MSGLGEGVRERQADVARTDDRNVPAHRARRVQSGRDASGGLRRRRTARRVVREPRARSAAPRSPGRSGSKSVFAPTRTVSIHSVRRAQRHARHAQPVRLLLQAAGVGHDARRAGDEREHLEVAERLDRLDVGAGAIPCSSMTCRVRGCTGKTNVRPGRGDPGQEAAQPVGLGVRRAVHRQHGVRIGSRRSVAQRDRREQVERVAHDVADDLDATGARPRRRASRAIARRARAGAARRGRPRSGFAPRASTGRRSADRPRRARPERPRRPRRVRRRASSWCRRRRAPSPAARARARRGCAAPSRRDRPSGGRAGTQARRGRARRRRPARARGRSAARCAARPRRLPRRAARARAAPT